MSAPDPRSAQLAALEAECRRLEADLRASPAGQRMTYLHGQIDLLRAQLKETGHADPAAHP